MKADPLDSLDLSSFLRDGFIVADLLHQDPLYQLQKEVEKFFPCNPLEWGKQDVSQEDYVALVKTVADAVSESGLVIDLVRLNRPPPH